MVRVVRKKIAGINYLYFRGSGKEKVLANLDKKTINRKNLEEVLKMINDERAVNLRAIVGSLHEIHDLSQRKEFGLLLLIFLLSNPIKDEVLGIVGDSGLTTDDVKMFMPEGVDQDIYKKVIDTLSYK